MALPYFKLIKALKRTILVRPGAAAYCNIPKLINKKEFKTENNIKYLEDPDTFGNLSGHNSNQIIEDEGDIKEEQFLQTKPMNHQKLTIRQYADIIKQYLKHKRLKEAIDILEVRMLKEDCVKPENYIYNILIGACADVGYTKKAFKLFNDMKRRALPPTGDTYTCLFEACANSPWPENGLKNAKNLRNLMLEKGIEPNLTNYNAMIKAFGRCGDLISAFKLIDEMKAKKIKIRIHTFNHLLHACISDKESGLRHALIVWRKMLKLREKPNIYSFNLMLRCVKDCNLGSYEDMIDLINNIQEHIAIQNKNNHSKQIQSKSMTISQDSTANVDLKPELKAIEESIDEIKPEPTNTIESNSQLTLLDDNLQIELVDKVPKLLNEKLPNLLSKDIQMDKVLDLRPVQTPQEKFAIVGGLRGFLEEMAVLSVEPDIKTFTQMLPLLNNTEEENKLIDFMKNANIRTDIDFYNMLIKNRSMRRDYEDAFQVMTFIKEEQEIRNKRRFLKKSRRLNVDIMTYGALALACNSMECAEKLLLDMKDAQLKVNIEILGTLLRHGTTNSDFKYVLYIMDKVKEENIQPNDIFLKHLENFNSKCTNIIKIQNKNGQLKLDSSFKDAYKSFSVKYVQWLHSIDLEEALQKEDPWKQFKQSYPETVQRQSIKIEEPKKFYKRSRKYHKYIPNIL